MLEPLGCEGLAANLAIRFMYDLCLINFHKDPGNVTGDRENKLTFYWYGGHIELIRFEEYYKMPRGACAHFVFIFECFSGHFFLKFSWNKIVMGKKILVPYFDVIMIALFPRNIQWKTILEKGDHYYIQTWHKDLFSHYNLILRKL